jgi:tRNA threonylcarbamoyl adenosine modification protein (Sua5/YciO/YrdC/YwlC family)
MILEIHPKNPNARHIQQGAQLLRKGGVIIVPTDSVYAIVCDAGSSKAFERLCRIRGVQPGKARFSLLLRDLSHISEYTKPFSREIFKLLKASLPGPYTFILPAGGRVPDLFRSNKKSVGIRIPDNRIIEALIEAIDGPLISASLLNGDDPITPYMTDPLLIDEAYGNVVDVVIDGGAGQHEGSTVIDCTEEPPVLVRQGLGATSEMLLG